MLFKIPVVWEMWGMYHIEAKSLDEARRKIFASGIGLPYGYYVDDSMEIDEEGILIHNEQTTDTKECL